MANHTPQDAALPFEVYPTYFVQCDTSHGKLRTQAYEVHCRQPPSSRFRRKLRLEANRRHRLGNTTCRRQWEQRSPVPKATWRECFKKSNMVQVFQKHLPPSELNQGISSCAIREAAPCEGTVALTVLSSGCRT
jgi:hypothetical protein